MKQLVFGEVIGLLKNIFCSVHDLFLDKIEGTKFSKFEIVGLIIFLLFFKVEDLIILHWYLCQDIVKTRHLLEGSVKPTSVRN